LFEKNCFRDEIVISGDHKSVGSIIYYHVTLINNKIYDNEEITARLINTQMFTTYINVFYL